MKKIFIISCLILGIFGLWQINKTIFAETSGSAPESNFTSRLKTISDVLTGLSFGDTGSGTWGDWGAMWNRIYKAGIWNATLGDATVADVRTGKTFYAGANRTLQTGTAVIPTPTPTPTPTPAWSCGQNLTVAHTEGTVAPVTKTVTYGTVSSTLGGTGAKCWITQNLGATTNAATVSESTEPNAGWYWQFNRMQGYKHDGTTRTPSSTWITSISETSDWTAANDPCTLLLGTGWRIPTNAEWTNADSTGSWTTWTEPFASALKLHAAGYLFASSGALSERGASGSYWSSSQYSSTYGYYLYFDSGYSAMNYYSKAGGFSVRCLKD